ncbi:MAG: transposase [Oscillospiraceae bacterium]|nr:transposase [Oscillospiraceae bacterium]
MIEFMKEFINSEETYLIDGTRFFSSSNKSSYARKGYNTKKVQTKQINVLYLFARNSRSPVYYQLLPGNIVDKSEVERTLRESEVKNCIVIGDNGCYSKNITGYMDTESISYIYPLRTDTTYVDEAFRSTPGYKKYDDALIYHGRTVWYKKQPVGTNGKYIYIYQDSGTKGIKENHYIERYTAGYEGYTLEDFYNKQQNYGMTFLYSSIDTDPKEIYLAYKTRWELEELFDYLKNGLDLGRISQQSNVAMEAWAFLNHICIMMFYSLCRRMADAGLSDQYAAENLIGLAKNISKVQINDKWYLSAISKTDKDLFAQIGVSFE